MTTQIKIHDDFLGIQSIRELEGLLMGELIPWQWSNQVVGKESKIYPFKNPDPLKPSVCNHLDDFQFTHMFYHGNSILSEGFQCMKPFLDNSKMGIKSLIKCKANLVPRGANIVKHGFHRDVDFHCTTAIFYVNTNNGYTEFEDGTRVESLRNRLVTFPSVLMHTGTTCTDTPKRVVINFNYFTAKSFAEF